MRKFFALAAILVATAATSGAIHAAEKAPKATAAKVPAALKALGANQEQVLSTKEAHEIRGQRIWFEVIGNFATQTFVGGFHAKGDVDYIKLWSDPQRVFVEIQDRQAFRQR